MLDIGLYFLVWKENSRGDRDVYHRFLQFLILDLHKSEVGPSNFFFSKLNFLFKNLFFLLLLSKIKFLFKKKLKTDFSGPFYPSTPGLKLCCH